jgi:hypothetical protein
MYLKELCLGMPADTIDRISGLTLLMTLPGRHLVHLIFHPYG